MAQKGASRRNERPHRGTQIAGISALLCSTFDPYVCKRFPSLEDRTGLCAGLCLLGIDLPGYRDRGGKDSAGTDVRDPVPDRWRSHAGLLRDTRTENPVFGAAAVA